VFYLSWGLSLVAILAIGFSRTLRYKTPYNFLFLVGDIASLDHGSLTPSAVPTS
jgi:hypothetical protein